MADIQLDFNSPLSKDEITARMRLFGGYLGRHGIQVVWIGDIGYVNGKFMTVDVKGKVYIRQNGVTLEARDPGFLWREKAKSFLIGEIGKCLDPNRRI